MTLVDADGQDVPREVDDIPEPSFGHDDDPGEAEYYNWEYDEPPNNTDQAEEDYLYEYPEEEVRVKEESGVVIKLCDVQVQVEELDEYEEEEEDEEEERDTPRAALLAAWWEYKRQNRQKRKKKRILILCRVDTSDRNADEEEFKHSEPC